VIRSWANSATRQFAESGKNKFSGMDAEVAEDLLAALHAATSLDDLSPLKSVGLHKLNGPWRICFRFADGDAWDVEIVDYH
jgi:proteic killer suppression protein